MNSDFNSSLTSETRRNFVKKTAGAAAILATTNWSTFANAQSVAATHSVAPWFKTAVRWGQTNIVEIDPLNYDIDWWRQHWKNTKVQGVVINGGGIVCYYPSKVPYHRRAEFLGDRDLLGELTAAAHEDGLAVFARMDANRADQEFYDAHPDWFAHDVNG